MDSFRGAFTSPSLSNFRNDTSSSPPPLEEAVELAAGVHEVLGASQMHEEARLVDRVVKLGDGASFMHRHVRLGDASCLAFPRCPHWQLGPI